MKRSWRPADMKSHTRGNLTCFEIMIQYFSNNNDVEVWTGQRILQAHQ